jgi:hypothetical protein
MSNRKFRPIARSRQTILFVDAAHLPNLELFSDFMDLVYLGCLVELQNALCTLSYEECNDSTLLALLQRHDVSATSALSNFDFSAMTHELRVQNVYSRGRMVSLLKFHISKRYLLRDATGNNLDPWNDVFIPTLAHFITALTSYHAHTFTLKYIKQLAQKGEPHPVPPALFNAQIRSSARHWNGLDAAVRAKQKSRNPRTLFPKVVPFSIVKRPNLDGRDIDIADSGMQPDLGPS